MCLNPLECIGGAGPNEEVQSQQVAVPRKERCEILNHEEDNI